MMGEFNACSVRDVSVVSFAFPCQHLMYTPMMPPDVIDLGYDSKNSGNVACLFLI